MSRWMLAVATATVIAAVVCVAFLMNRSEDEVMAQGSRSVTLTVFRSTESGDEGQNCILYHNPEIPEIHRTQMIITAANGDVVGAINVDQGTVSIDEEIGSFCEIQRTMDLEMSTFYTFEVDGVYKYTASAGELESAGNEFVVILEA